MLNPVDLTSALGLLDYPVIKVYKVIESNYRGINLEEIMGTNHDFLN